MHSYVFLIKPSFPYLCFPLTITIHPSIDLNDAEFEPEVTGLGGGCLALLGFTVLASQLLILPLHFSARAALFFTCEGSCIVVFGKSAPVFPF